MIITTLKDAVREARNANRRAVAHRARWGTVDCGSVLYQDHEFRQRDTAMAWARRYKSAARKAASCTDRQLIATINSTAKHPATSVELRAFRAEADRRRSILRLAA